MCEVAFIFMGGTIASKTSNPAIKTKYKAGKFGAKDLINKEIKKLCKIKIIELENIDSAEVNEALWIRLLGIIERLKNINSIVIAHGTDTMEESAYFLDLVLENKSVIFTGAMRPKNALSSDGANNLYNAFLLARYFARKKIDVGAIIAMNDRIFSAREAQKSHTMNLNAWESRNARDLGYIIDDEIIFYEAPKPRAKFFDLKDAKNLERVDILYAYASDNNDIAANILFESGTKGLIIAGFGSGNISEKLRKALKNLQKKGLIVALSTRVAHGFVVNHDKDFICAKDLSPQKARILLALAIGNKKTPKQIQNLFSRP